MPMNFVQTPLATGRLHQHRHNPDIGIVALMPISAYKAHLLRRCKELQTDHPDSPWAGDVQAVLQ